ncbi:MAG: hypothetical protein WC838_03190 [Candidatus Margulisiibacteriota bacterium]|jgi:hypothetical protein
MPLKIIADRPNLISQDTKIVLASFFALQEPSSDQVLNALKNVRVLDLPLVCDRLQKLGLQLNEKQGRLALSLGELNDLTTIYRSIKDPSAKLTGLALRRLFDKPELLRAMLPLLPEKHLEIKEFSNLIRNSLKNEQSSFPRKIVLY